MEGENNYIENNNQLAKLKTLFSKFVAVATNINVLHDSMNLENKLKEELDEKKREVISGSSPCCNALVDTNNFTNLPSHTGCDAPDSNLAITINGLDCEPNSITYPDTSKRCSTTVHKTNEIASEDNAVGSATKSNVELLDIDSFPNEHTDHDGQRQSNLSAINLNVSDGRTYDYGASDANFAMNGFPNIIDVMSTIELAESSKSNDFQNLLEIDTGSRPCLNALVDAKNLMNPPKSTVCDASYSNFAVTINGFDCEPSSVMYPQNSEECSTTVDNTYELASEEDAIGSAPKSNVVLLESNFFPKGHTAYVDQRQSNLSAVNLNVSNRRSYDCGARDANFATNGFPNTGDAMHEVIVNGMAQNSNELDAMCDGNGELHGGACSDVMIDVEMNPLYPNTNNASDSISIDTYPLLMEVTDIENWDNLQTFTIGTETFYTNGELTYDPSMDWDNENRDSSLQIIDESIINLQKNQIHTVIVEEQNDQSHIISMPVYENFMFGYEDDMNTSIDQNISNVVTQSESLSPTQLFMKAESSQRSCDNRSMVLSTSNQPKRLFCVYCKKTFPKLARHITEVHKNEVEVKRLKQLPKGSKERLSILAGLRKRGYFEYNSDPKYNNNVILTSRRPNINRPRKSILPTTCANCMGPYSKSSIRHHFKKCTGNALNGDRSVLLLSKLVEGRIHKLACDTLRLDIFPYMTEDEVVVLIRFDWLVIVYGNKLCDRHLEVFQNDVISQKLRRTGRLLKELKSIEPDITDLASLFQPKYYDCVIKAIRVLGKFDPVTKCYGSPSTALAVVTEIRAVGATLVAEYIKQENFESQSKTENFLKLYNTDVPTAINKAVYRTQAKRKRDKREILPSTEDVRLLATFVDRERKSYFASVSKQFTYSGWLKLAEYTMASLIVFNRRRTGETQNILVTDFERRERLDHQMIATLSKEDQQVARKYCRMKTRGKLDRTVPVLLKPDVEKCIELLIRFRKHAKIPIKNEFLFALPTFAGKRIRRVDACALLRKLSLLCGAKHPETLRGTKMRKHIATMCVSMELNENSVSEVADFMGHHEKIHRKYYRQMPIVREIVKMSRILQSAQGAFDEEDDDDDEEDEIEDENQDENEDMNQDENEDMNQDEYENENELNQDENGIFENVSNEMAKHNENDTDDDIDESARDTEENIDDRGARDIDEGNGHVEGESKKYPKKRWSDAEKAAAHKAFETYFKEGKLPSKKVILDQKRHYIDLDGRSHEMIKAWISNQFKKKSV